MAAKCEKCKTIFTKINVSPTQGAFCPTCKQKLQLLPRFRGGSIHGFKSDSSTMLQSSLQQLQKNSTFPYPVGKPNYPKNIPIKSSIANSTTRQGSISSFSGNTNSSTSTSLSSAISVFSSLSSDGVPVRHGHTFSSSTHSPPIGITNPFIRSVAVNSDFVFETWLREVCLVDIYIGKMNETQQEAFLIYLLQIYTNNASHRISELKRLGLPANPFQYYSRNHYLRTNTLDLTDLPLSLLFGENRHYFEIVQPGFKQVLMRFHSKNIRQLDEFIKNPIENLQVSQTKSNTLRIIAEQFFKKLHGDFLLWIGEIDCNIILEKFNDILNQQIIKALHLHPTYKQLAPTTKVEFENYVQQFASQYDKRQKWIGICINHPQISQHLLIGNGYLKNIYSIDVRKVLNKSGYWPDKRSMLMLIVKWMIVQNRQQNSQMSFFNLLIRELPKRLLNLNHHLDDKDQNDLKQLVSYPRPITQPLQSNLFEVAVEQLNQFQTTKTSYQRSYIPMILSVVKTLRQEKEFQQNNNCIQLIKNCLGNSIQKCINSCNNLILFVQSFQSFLEILLTYCRVTAKSSIRRSLNDTVIQTLPPSIKPQYIRLTSYAMQSVTHILIALQTCFVKRPFQIGTLMQNYFEIPENMRRMGYSIHYLLSLEDDDEDGYSKLKQSSKILKALDVLFVDFHPNNAARNSLFSNRIQKWLISFMASRQDPFVLVVDITLNTLTDRVIHDFLVAAKPHVSEGKLNLIFLQSLTKFAQLGADSISAGLDITFNNNCNFWQVFNTTLKQLTPSSIAPEYSTFFSIILNCQDSQSAYLQMLRDNTSKVYQRLAKYLGNKLPFARLSQVL